MKKQNTLLTLLIMGFFALVNATTLTTAVDFTASDVNGKSHNLFEYLNEGKWVLLKFTSLG